MAARIVLLALAGALAIAAPTPAPAAGAAVAATSDVADLDAARRRVEELTDAKDFATALDEARKLDAIVRSRFGTSHTHYAVTLTVIARVHYAQGKFDEAEKLYRQALKIREDADGPNNAKTENTLIGLANSLYSQRKYAEAEPFYLRALALCERAVGTSHSSLISLLINIGDDYRLQKKHAPAEEPYRRALALREKELGVEHADLVTILFHLADGYKDQRKFAEAVPLYERAIKIRSKDGAEHPELVKAFDNLGFAAYSLRNYGAAADSYARALKLYDKQFGADHADTVRTRQNLARSYSSGGRMAELEDLYRDQLAARERAVGADHVDVIPTIESLASTLLSEKKFDEAEVLYARVVDIRERAQGVDHADTARAVVNLSWVHLRQNRFAAAERMLREALDKRSPDAAVILIVQQLTFAYYMQGRYADAEALGEQMLAKLEQARGSDDPQVAAAAAGLGYAYMSQGKYAASERLYRRALDVRERLYGPDHVDVAHSLNGLSEVVRVQGRFAEAEALVRRALAIRERARGPNHNEVAETLMALGGVYIMSDRPRDAEPLFRRAMTIREKVFGQDRPETAAVYNSLGYAIREQGRHQEAEVWTKRALAIRERVLGPNHPDVSFTLTQLAISYQEQGRHDEALRTFERSLAIREQAFGPDHNTLAGVLYYMAVSFRSQGRYAEAEQAAQRAMAIRSNAAGDNHPDVARILDELSRIAAGRGDPAGALAQSRQAVAKVIRHAETETASPGTVGVQTGDGPGGLVELRADYFQRHVANLVVAATQGLEPASALAGEGFETAQWAGQSAAAAAVQQMAARFASGSGALADLVRERQDLMAMWRDRNKELLNAVSASEATRDAGAIDALRKAIAAIEPKLAAVNARLATEFPQYTELATPKPLDADATRKLLTRDEALVYFMVGERESEVFVVTSDGLEWRALPLGSDALSKKITAFRKALSVESLDAAAAAGAPELFDLGLAFELYALLLGPIQPQISGRKHLIVVPSGPLTALPFHLLVTDRLIGPAPNVNNLAPYRDAAWLIRRHSVTVLPSVGSLRGLRAFAQKDHAAKPMIGFADPVFGSEPPATTARTEKDSIARVTSKTRAYTDYWRGVAVDRARLAQALPRLEDTADEVRIVAQKLGGDPRDIYLRGRASEAEVKQAKLSDYRVVYFATHGLVAGDVKGLAEPALALTMPKAAGDLDDGLLTASEVAQLKLNADWVVLSACNTIAGDKPGAEALSGLARAFFYAGARALLVSHWSVDSNAATRLTTSTFDIMKSDPSIGRAEALRRAMLAYLGDRSVPRNAYPAFWGPFALIGEGAVR